MTIDITLPYTQVAKIINNHFPEVTFDAAAGEQTEMEYSETITAYALQLLDEGNSEKVKYFFSLLTELYSHCENGLATAIEKVLMCRIGQRMEVDNNRWDMLALLPESFKLLISKELIRA